MWRSSEKGCCEKRKNKKKESKKSKPKRPFSTVYLNKQQTNRVRKHPHHLQLFSLLSITILARELLVVGRFSFAWSLIQLQTKNRANLSNKRMFGRSPSLLLKHLLTMIKLTVAFLLLSSTISAFTFKTFFGASSNNRGGCSSFGGGGYSRRGHSRSGRLDMSSKPPPSSPYDEYDDAIGAPVGPLPSVSSKINYGDQTPQNVCHDLWVVGSGTLGMLALKEWMSLYPDSKVVAETKTENRHAELSRLGVTPRLRSQRSGADDRTARYLLICIPPSASATYVEEIHSSCQLWAGPLGQGHMAFTSSTVVYGDSNGNTVDEIFRLDTRSQRSTQ